LSAQPVHDLKQQPFREKGYTPKAVYTAKADIISESLLVYVMLEVEYRNNAQDSLPEIIFSLPSDISNNIFHLDSILYRGVPLTETQLQFDHSLMKVILPASLRSGEKAFFLMSYDLKLSPKVDDRHDCVIALDDWLPQVAVFRHDRWYTGHDSGTILPPHEYAIYYVAVRIDTAYSLAFQGELINDKEHFGLLPRLDSDTILVDIAAHSMGASGEHYSPVFESGRKIYLMRSHNVPGFKAVVRRNWIRDRTVVDNTAIEICYYQEIESQWAGKVVRTTRDIMSCYQKWLGSFPYKTLTVTAAAGMSQRGEPFVSVSPELTDPNMITTELAVGIAQCWLLQLLPEKRKYNRYLIDGLTAFMASAVLYDMYGDKGYRILLEYRQNNPDTILTSSLIWEVASWFYLMQYLNGGNHFWEQVKTFIENNRHDFVYEEDYLNMFTDSTHKLKYPTLSDMTTILDSTDIQLIDFDISSDSSNYELKCEVKIKSSFAFPIEIAIVFNNTDTLYDTLYLSEKDAGGWRQTFEWSLTDYPNIIILDPHYRLPDSDRRNNYGYVRQAHRWFRPDKAIFPGFIRLAE